MSFSDLMSSGRGPGVLGMLMALLVLVGFGILFMYASDDMAKAPSRSIESVISEQKDNINHHTVHLEEQHKMLAKLPERIALEKVLSDKNEAIKMTQEKLTALKANLESVKSEIATGESKFLAYKDEYRAYARNQAKGQIMETLTTRNGTIYKNVNIREVTAIGIQIRHDEGHKRISFEELSDELIDHYQYDPSQKEQALKQEMETRAKHDAEVALANTKSSELQAQQQALNAEAEKKEIQRQIIIKKSQIGQLKDSIQDIEEEQLRANNEASAIKRSGKTYKLRKNSFETDLQSKKLQINQLESEISQLKGGR